MPYGLQDGLNFKQRQFCLEFLKDFDPCAALIRAGYKISNPKSTSVRASNLFAIPAVKNFLAETHKAQVQRSRINVDKILNHLEAMAFFDIADIIDKDTQDFKPLNAWPEVARKVVAEYTVETTETKIENSDDGQTRYETTVRVKKVKIPDRVKNTENLGRYLQMFIDRIDIHNNQELKVFFIPQFDPKKELHPGAGGMLAGARRQLEHDSSLPEPPIPEKEEVEFEEVKP